MIDLVTNRTLHIIEPTFDFGTINSTSVLLVSVDTPIENNEYHTSLGDLNPAEIIAVAKHFSNINFVDKNFDPTSDLYKETLLLLNHFCGFKTVTRSSQKRTTNFIPDSCLSFSEARIKTRSNDPVLWVFGCSHSHGTGLLPGEKKFADIVAEHLGLPLMLVSRPGSSLHWSTRNLFAADIRQGDTVIWQLTAPHRISCYNGSEVEEIMLSRTLDPHLLEVYNDNQVFFNQISLLNFGVAYLRQIGVNFVLIDYPVKKSLEYEYLAEYSKYPEYCYAPGCRLDLGSDNLHMGPLSHQAIAQRLIDHIQCLYD